jgi:hypothetical protein
MENDMIISIGSTPFRACIGVATEKIIPQSADGVEVMAFMS